MDKALFVFQLEISVRDINNSQLQNRLFISITLLVTYFDKSFKKEIDLHPSNKKLKCITCFVTKIVDIKINDLHNENITFKSVNFLIAINLITNLLFIFIKLF